jgi:hypothetical protein
LRNIDVLLDIDTVPVKRSPKTVVAKGLRISKMNDITTPSKQG